MSLKKRTLLASVVGIALMPLLVACGGDTATSDGGAPTTSVTPSDSSTPDASATTDTSSGGKPVLANGKAPAERTLLVASSGITPSSITIKVGENVTFKAGETGAFAVEVGGLDSATVNGGLIETFEFPQAGVYEVKEIITNNTATITVE